MDKRLTVVVVQVNQDPEVREIPDRLESFQEIVGGYIETITITVNGKRYRVVLDEEGKLKDKRANIVLKHDVLVGDLFITKAENGRFVSFDQDDIRNVRLWADSFQVRY